MKHVEKGLAALGKDYAGKPLGIVAISSNDVATHPADSPAGLKQQASTFGFNFPYLHDETQAVARAFLHDPSVLLLDEPLSALDGAASDALLVRLQEWASEHGVQTVLATHDAADALATGAEVALLHEGRLAALGPAAEVLANERSRLIHRLSTNLSS